MYDQPPTPDAQLKLAQKVLGSEEGIQTLLRDVRKRVEVASRDEEVAKQDVERAKAKLVMARTTHQNWEQFLGILDALADRWGVKDFAVLPTQVRSQANGGDPGVAPVVVDPETRERQEDGKLCMYRDQKTKKWCPTRLTRKRKEYCAKHHALVYGREG